MPAEGQASAGGVQVQRNNERDVAILHNEQFFAAAQKKYVYIYDKRGLEVHCLKVIDGTADHSPVHPRVMTQITIHQQQDFDLQRRSALIKL